MGLTAGFLLDEGGLHPLLGQPRCAEAAMNARPFQAEVLGLPCLGPAVAAKRPFELCPDVAGADRAIDAPAPWRDMSTR
jgi:hypothetical protein